MRLKPHREEKPPPPSPFPIHLYIVGVTDSGEEALRYDLHAAFTAYGETVHIEDPTLEIIPH